ncbi:proteasome subunit alpha type-5 [Artemisia annua]|uniref:Dolichyl-diphosphooligosaccharide--protein glycosyltransferase subunit 2 n=1 Tax=Artemisia annua TaxID=35608 RepID=A0A2U1LPV4_ARTAN|nr:proteasome subunit alpha type-5 [Artemisia annua]
MGGHFLKKLYVGLSTIGVPTPSPQKVVCFRLSMLLRPLRTEYDRGANTFSPEGRLFQVEYAIKLGSTAIGLKTKEGVVLAVEKRITSPLLEPSSVEKIMEIDEHIGCAMSGLIADARTRNHRFSYGEPMTVESTTQALCDLALRFGEGEEESMFWLSLLLASLASICIIFRCSRPKRASLGLLGYLFSLQAMMKMVPVYDGAYYFDDKHIDASGHQGPLSATSAVVRGLSAFAATSGSLNIPEDKILGLARFFLGIGIPGNSKDLVSVPLILSVPATVLSLTSKDKLKFANLTLSLSSGARKSIKWSKLYKLIYFGVGESSLSHVFILEYNFLSISLAGFSLKTIDVSAFALQSRFYLGEVRNGAAMKLVVNMIMGSMMTSFAEGLLLSEKVYCQ